MTSKPHALRGFASTIRFAACIGNTGDLLQNGPFPRQIAQTLLRTRLGVSGPLLALPIGRREPTPLPVALLNVLRGDALGSRPLNLFTGPWSVRIVLSQALGSGLPFSQ